VDLTTLAGYAVHAWSFKSSFTGRRKLGIFFGGRLTDLMCLDSSLLMRLKVVLTKGRKANETGFSGADATLFGKLRARHSKTEEGERECKFCATDAMMSSNRTKSNYEL
jgi:hypothetical protein